jgi:hypothetical protein
LSTALGLAALMALAGCDYLGIEPASKATEARVAEGKAIGGACRHANRALEDCYRYNPKANKAAVFDGWKDMDAYMRDNKLDTIAPVTPPEAPKKPAAQSAYDDVITVPADKPADKAADKKAPAAKH